MVNKFGKPVLKGFALLCLVLTTRVCGEALGGQMLLRFPNLLDHGTHGTASLGHALASAYLGGNVPSASSARGSAVSHTVP